METTQLPTTFAEAEAVLAEKLPGYESRPQQQRLAQEVEACLAQDSLQGSPTHLVAQAGCGTGKSLGYLIPAILSGKRVVIATATKALQDQIATKDLPFLEENLGVPFTWAVVKGRSNYACLAELRGDEADAQPNIDEIRAQVEEILAEQMNAIGPKDEVPVTLKPRMGERDDLPEMEHKVWAKITVSGEDCPGRSNCPMGESCFAERAKELGKAANIVVVNHALLFTDLFLKEVTGGVASMLGEYDFVVFDEAHEAEEYAKNMLGTQFTEAGLRQLATEVRNFARKWDNGEAAEDAAGQLGAATQQLWSVLEPGKRVRGATVAEHEAEWENLAIALSVLVESLSKVSLDMVPDASYPKVYQRKTTLLNRARNARDRAVDIIVDAATTEVKDNLVTWIEEETTRRGDKRKVIKSAPVDVSATLRDWLFEKTPAILVSATILVDGKPDYVVGRLGVTDHSYIDVGTPFDFQAQARLFLDRSLPDPGKEREVWEVVSVEKMLELVLASEGRALLLFTGTKQMKRAFEQLKDRIPQECKVQGGGMNNRDLGEWFKTNHDSVLFATRSFMTGFDVQGQSLSLVVIDKLPFPVPTEPMVEATCEQIEADGGNSFRDYTTPVMSLVLQQAHGRLIRHRNDKGVVAILDPRMETKAYGKTILRSLPASPKISTVTEVADFLSA